MFHSYNRSYITPLNYFKMIFINILNRTQGQFSQFVVNIIEWNAAEDVLPVYLMYICSIYGYFC